MKNSLIKIITVVIILSVGCEKKNNAPERPDTPDGPSYGFINSPYSFSSSAIDLEEDSVLIRFSWGDHDTSNWSEIIPSGVSVKVNHTWTIADTYDIRAQAKDPYNKLSNWSDNKVFIVTSNHAPLTPSYLQGPPNGIVNVYYSFTTQALDPDNDSIAYQFDWGNGTTSNWTNFLPSDSPVTMSSRWSDTGQYSIRVRAKDNKGEISGWSLSYYITISLSSSGFPNHTVAIIPVGNRPTSLTVLPNGNYVYVTNENQNDVSVIRTSDNTVIATIPVGNQPSDVSALPNSNYIYVTNENSNTVSVIRTSDNTVIATIPVGSNPTGVTTLPNGNYVYVINSLSDNVTVIRTSDNTITDTISVGINPWSITALPNGNFIYVTNIGSSNISVINTLDNTVVTTIQLSDIPYYICASPNNEFVYVTHPFNNRFTVIQTSTNSIIATITVGNNPYVITTLPNGNYIYVVNSISNDISVISAINNTVVALIPVQFGPYGVTAHPNGNTVYVTNSLSNNVSVIVQ